LLRATTAASESTYSRLGRPEPPALRDHVCERRKAEATEQQLPGERQRRQPAARSVAVVALEELDRPARRAGEREPECGVVGVAEEPVLERRGVGEQLDRAAARPPRGHEPFPEPHGRTVGLYPEPLRPHTPRAGRTLRHARDELVHRVRRQPRGYELPPAADESPQGPEVHRSDRLRIEEEHRRPGARRRVVRQLPHLVDRVPGLPEQLGVGGVPVL
jgi:hypothetical protein